MRAGKIATGNEKDISIVHFLDYPTKSNLSTFENSGFLGKAITQCWLDIQQNEVSTLLQAAEQVPPSHIKIGLKDKNDKKGQGFPVEPIAIVGMSCRYPGSNNLKEFWELLFAGGDGTCNPPEFRWLPEQSIRRSTESHRKTNAGFLKVPVDEFDAKFFGISPKEALFMDPQNRLLLELVWESLEDAGIDPHSLHDTSGSVFVGAWMHDFKDILVQSGNTELYRVYMGNSLGASAARISFLLGLTGPCVATESGCSSAIVAVHMACRSLQQGETNMALACGVNLLLHPFGNDVFPMVVSRDGHSKTFSEDADGFARAEGGGVLVLKRLSDAIANGDQIWGLIRGSGLSQEGVSKSMGTPTVHAESLAMTTALADAQVDPADVTYVEAHGTGTTVGDPMEVAAIAKAYHSPLRTTPLVIGSVKTNVGHTESCSGITGIMKVILSMQHEVIPQHRNFTRLNHDIDLDAVPAILPLEPVPWKKTNGKSRIAGISSFGITGTDAHVIVEESPQFLEDSNSKLKCAQERPLHLLKLSAKSEEALIKLLEKYQKYCFECAEEEPTFADIAYSANMGRANFLQHRVAILARDKDDFISKVESSTYLKGELVEEDVKATKICFLFTGQGSQYVGMAKGLYTGSPVFKMHFDRCHQILQNNFSINLFDCLQWSGGEKYGYSEDLSRALYSQTGIFCVEYALLKLWESWGVKPDYVLGHSLGEFCAAVAANILSLEDALKLVAERSRLIDALPRGKMLVVKGDYLKVSQHALKLFKTKLESVLDVAALNSAEQTVIAGDTDKILSFAEFCKENGVQCRILDATHAYHSRHMDAILADYEKIAATVSINSKASCYFISGVRGTLISNPEEEMNVRYWLDHTRDKVNFLSASQQAVELGCQVFVEVGPTPVLSALMLMNNTQKSLTCLPSLRRGEDDWHTLLTCLGRLYLKGIPIDWQAYDQFYGRSKVRLPTYPFMGTTKFWPVMQQHMGIEIHPLLGALLSNATPAKIFQNGIFLENCGWMRDHCIGDLVIFPATAFLEVCLVAGFAAVQGLSSDGASSLHPTRPIALDNLTILAPLSIGEDKSTQLQTVVNFVNSKDNADALSSQWNKVQVKVYHRQEDGSWLLHATSAFVPLVSVEETTACSPIADVATIVQTLGESEKIQQVYEKLASIGLNFGPRFRSIEMLWKLGESSILAKLKTLAEDDVKGHLLHPVYIDAMIQAIMVLKLSSNLKKKLYVPIKIQKFVWLAPGVVSTDIYIQACELTPTTDPLCTSSCHAMLLDNKGTLLAQMSGVEMIDTTVRAVESILAQQQHPLPDLWEEVWKPMLGPNQYPTDLESLRPDLGNWDEYEGVIKKYNQNVELSETQCQLDVFVYYQMLLALLDCGWTPEENQLFRETELMEQLEIKQEFFKQFQYFLRVFSEEGWLRKEGGESEGMWRVEKRPPTKQQLHCRLGSSEYSEKLVEKFPSTKILGKVGDNLSSLLRGKTSVLSILFPEKGESGALEFYNDTGKLFRFGEMSMEITQHWLRRFQASSDKKGKGNKSRELVRILEVGAGTGGYTETTMDIISSIGLDFEYIFTDITSVFFPEAEKRLEKYAGKITFKKLNIEEDPISQGFTPGFFDAVLASDVIHATRDLRQSLQNVKTLLRPGGIFDLNEMITQSRFVSFLFGLLEGFWRFEDYDLRQNHCTLSAPKWTEVLEECGFSVLSLSPCGNDHHANIKSYKQLQETDLVTTGSCTASSSSTLKTWIVFPSKGHFISDWLTQNLPRIATHRKVVLVEESSSSAESLVITPDSSEEDFVAFVRTVKEIYGQVEGVIYCWPLDNTKKSQEQILRPFFHLTKSLCVLPEKVVGRLIILVDSVCPVNADGDVAHINASTIVGYMKSLQNENSELKCKYIDVGMTSTEDDPTATAWSVFYELWREEKDIQVAYRDSVARYIPKLIPLKPALRALELPVAASVDRFQLILPSTKSIADLQFGPLDSITLAEDELEVEVRASALNFRDVLSVVKPIEQFDKMNVVGFDMAGVVVRVGEKVSKFQIGDRVFGINTANNALPSHVKVNESELLAIPEHITFCEASTLPAVVATSYYCLMEVAKITARDTVLIHTASGGVGLTAIQICQYIGATVIATAGNKRKQNYLRSLGIQHIFHSRNTKYEQDILKVTNGRGVDVVLNSLTSEGFKEATLNACAKNARFIEMSKLTIWKPEEVASRRPDVNYTIVDLSSLKEPEYRELVGSMEKFIRESKAITPTPYVRFDAVHIREALQFLQKAKHIGKVVCVLPKFRQKDGRTEVCTPIFHDNVSYLITGGLGGIGFQVCHWMLEKGAKYIVLAGRNPPTQNVQEKVDRWNNEYGAKVVTVTLDVADYESCRTLMFDQLPQKLGFPALKGIMHAAGTLSDGLVENQTWETLSKTLGAKVVGSLNLHQLSKELPGSGLEHFVLFSSGVCLFGSPGQSNHAAGNQFEDTLAHYRHSVGLPATSINWGQWGEVGVATEIDIPGIRPLSTLQGLTALEYALKSQRTQTAVINVESFLIMSKLFPQVANYLDERVWKSCQQQSTKKGFMKSSEFWQQYDSQPDVEAKLIFLKGVMKTVLRDTLNLEEGDKIDDNADFQEMGVDSLMLVEMKNALQSVFGDRVTVNATTLRDCNTIQLLATKLVKIIEGEDLEGPPSAEQVARLMEEDSILPEHIKKGESQELVQLEKVACILLTGVTGTLGPYVLRELEKMGQIEKIYCLIRPKKKISALERLQALLQDHQINGEKVECVSGNVADAKFGLDDNVWDELTDQVDAIFHCAATVSHLEFYTRHSEVRKSNVVGTIHVLELACVGRKLKQVFYASSLLTVTKMENEGKSISEEWPDDCKEYSELTNVAYPITKFVGEILMKTAALERQIPIKVVRYPFISGDSQSGRFVLDQNHMMLRYFYILKKGIMPSNPIPVMALPVDACAFIGVYLFFHKDAKDNIYNVTTENPGVDQDFVGVATRLGYQVKIVEFSEFQECVRNATEEDGPIFLVKELYLYRDDDELAGLYNSIPISQGWLQLEDDLQRKQFFVSRRLNRFLPDFEPLKKAALEYIYQDLEYAKAQGWLAKYTS